MNKPSKLILNLLLTFTSVSPFYAQVYEKNADYFPLGVYTRDQVIADWNTTFGNGFSRRGRGEDRVSIVQSTAPDTGRALKIKYPKDQVDSKDSGAQWETNLKGKYEDLYLSYDMMFGPNFELIKPGPNTGRTGKLPGLAGGLEVDDKDDEYTAWDGKLQFRDQDELEFNVKTPLNNSKHFTWLEKAYTIPKGRWFNIEIRYKLNTVGQKDGIMQAWLDGVLLGQYLNAEFRDNPNVKINKMFFSTFYGGNFENDAPTQDVFAYFDNFIVDTQRINKPVGSTTNEPVLSILTHNNKSNQITVMPNPSNNGIFKLNLNTEWTVFSLTGNKIASGKDTLVNLSTQSPGMYILKVNNSFSKIIISK